MKKIATIVLFLSLASFCSAKTQKEEYRNDYLYSAEYFDYLIECAQQDRERMLEEQKQQEQQMAVQEFVDEDTDIITDEFTTFKLKIEEYVKTIPYKDSFKKIDTKTIIPIGDKVSIIQDMSKSRNKYNSDDYKIFAGVEFQPFKVLNFASGIETNYRDIDQNPASRKLYFSPELKFKDRISLKFHNKINMLNYSSDHDIGLKISPFKSKIADFGVYSGLNRKRNGTVTESINFSTNFYF